MRTATNTTMQETKLNKPSMRTYKSRKQAVETNAEGVISEKVKIVDNPKTARMQIVFKDKPAQEVRDTLKKLGFLWDPVLRLWKRFRNPRIFSWLQEYLKRI